MSYNRVVIMLLIVVKIARVQVFEDEVALDKMSLAGGRLVDPSGWNPARGGVGWGDEVEGRVVLWDLGLGALVGDSSLR